MSWRYRNDTEQDEVIMSQQLYTNIYRQWLRFSERQEIEQCISLNQYRTMVLEAPALRFVGHELSVQCEPH